MFRYNFDEIIERRNTSSLKYDSMEENGMPSDVMPFWVADMDFKAPPEVLEALIERCRHGVFGYTHIKPDYFSAVYSWYSKRFGYEIKNDWLVVVPGIVFAVCTAIRAFTEKGDAVLIQRPVYYPFSSSIKGNDRKLINNPLVYGDDGKYHIDFDDFEKKIRENNVKMFILCSPHNPVCRVWSYEELKMMGEICKKYNVIVVSDEIHSDFVYTGNKHTVFSTISEEFADMSVICTSPSKTFNLAGLQLSNIFIKNEQMRRKFIKEFHRTGYNEPNVMGVVSAQAAYEKGEAWLEELLEYLKGNIVLAKRIIDSSGTKLKMIEPEGTYLLWVDCRNLGMDSKKLDRFIIDKASLWLDGGTMFGEEGEGFQRINAACPSKLLEKGLTRLAEVIKQR